MRHVCVNLNASSMQGGAERWRSEPRQRFAVIKVIAVIKVMGPIFMATFFVFVPIPQFLGYPPASSVWDLTINTAIGISDGRSLKPMVQWLPNLNFALSGIHG
jgi:hypothetical protein